mmetsp:Transcript_1659/g.4408  ORF Transcript_1659/g.4408 Transcript_1659/m.4408 type:complete len:216 (-) Transcript_1659:74-721(-)|eukprot:CAMPEP_0185832942 /NCGR_PEP_ID=MMETSP1353-20130828/2385_1 /TAXON_ID=1077150 /ORGANISM="Erythrolobus australicus, Strain CCMP3124" /LENGTH=215 /DNA_ID=CAMNT_0028531179 /DNA_START=61 /DNA_END=708 /DNA_ORIENTATION=-
MAFVSVGAISGTKARFSAVSAQRVNCARRSSVAMMAEKSPSVPFMDRPPALDGSMPGDVGFDPLGISSFLNLKWLREAELKHGRICMLAALGWIVQELYTFPFYPGAPHIPTAAHDYMARWNGPLGQILLFTSFFEIMTLPAVIQMITGESDRAPGDFCFDPLGLGKDPEKLYKYQVNEVKNGRLAMIAVGGFVHQAWLSNMGALEQLSKGKLLP